MRHALLLAVLVPALAACADKKTPAADSTAATPAAGQTTAAAPAAAAVTITSPAEGATTGKDVTVTLRATGVSIAKSDGAQTEGVGHYHLFLDTIPTPNGSVIPPGTAKIVHIGTGDSTFTFKNLASGKHQVIAVIGYGNHAAMPGTRDTVNFVVKP
jgi:hypothetical protein